MDKSGHGAARNLDSRTKELRGFIPHTHLFGAVAAVLRYDGGQMEAVSLLPHVSA